MNGKIFIDTSAWLAYSIPKDPYHKAVIKLFKEALSTHSPLFTSNDVIDETYTRFRYDSGWLYAQKFIEYIAKNIEARSLTQLWTSDQIQSNAFETLSIYNDHDLSLTDATSAALMSKHRISTIFTLDHKHFTTLGFRALPQPK